MAETNHFSDRLREPLNETTRKARRNLLAAALLGVVIAKVGLVPERISAFGVEFTSSNQQALVMLLIVAISYFCVSFIVYAYSELTAWQIVFTSKELEALREASERKASDRKDSGGFLFSMDEGEEERRRFHEHVRFLYAKSRPTFYVRLSVELLIPFFFAVYSCFVLAVFDISPSKAAPLKVHAPANKTLNKDVPPKGGPPVS